MAGRVRQPIDQAALETYLSRNVPEIELPLDVKQFAHGQSNPTYQLTSPSGARRVLRKKPPGTLLSRTAHGVEREYRIMRALSEQGIPVPGTYALCNDASVLGTAFYVMEFLDGRIFDDSTIPGVSPRERAEMWHDAIRTLASFHAVDPASVGLSDFGKTSGFYRRQLATWASICAAQARAVDIETKQSVGPLPHMDDLVQFFGNEARMPTDRATLVHGDYKIDNLVFHKTEPRVIGILDWEMSTIGHPLSDICNLLMQFYTASAVPSPAGWSHPGFRPGATPGLPTPEALLERYAEASRAAVSSAAPKSSAYDPREGGDVAWGVAFATYRLAAVCQGIAARHALRQASSEKADRYAEEMAPLANVAWDLAQRAAMEDAAEGKARL